MEEGMKLQSMRSEQPSVKAGPSSGNPSIPFLTPPTHMLHVSVSDTGIGIPPSRFFRLFKLFSQIDSSTTRIHGGTGLGLSIAERLSALMGGHMWVESPGVNQGSTFHFTIQTSRAPPQESMDIEASAKLKKQQGLHCLIIDTNEVTRMVLRNLIEALGINVHVAINFKEVTELLSQYTCSSH
jgi:CheY-like chemotaxis protein